MKLALSSVALLSIIFTPAHAMQSKEPVSSDFKSLSQLSREALTSLYNLGSNDDLYNIYSISTCAAACQAFYDRLLCHGPRISSHDYHYRSFRDAMDIWETRYPRHRGKIEAILVWEKATLKKRARKHSYSAPDTANFANAIEIRTIIKRIHSFGKKGIS